MKYPDEIRADIQEAERKIESLEEQLKSAAGSYDSAHVHRRLIDAVEDLIDLENALEDALESGPPEPDYDQMRELRDDYNLDEAEED